MQTRILISSTDSIDIQPPWTSNLFEHDLLGLELDGTSAFEKPSLHDCKQQKSWRCVWCEGLFCFDCDTGTTAPLGYFPHHRLCHEHYEQLPGSKPCARYKLHARAIGDNRPFSIDLRYIPKRGSSLREEDKADIHEKQKMRCFCLISKTLLCRDCVVQAYDNRTEQETAFRAEGKIYCAYKRFPGGCKAVSTGQECACNGKGVGCSFIDEDDLQQMETNDLLWLGRYGAMNKPERTEKKDLKSLFGENIPTQISDRPLMDDFKFTAPLKSPRHARSEDRMSRAYSMKRNTFGAIMPRRSLSIMNLNAKNKLHKPNPKLQERRVYQMSISVKPQHHDTCTSIATPATTPRQPRKISIPESETFLESASEDEDDSSDDKSSVATLSTASGDDDWYKSLPTSPRACLSAPPPPITRIATAAIAMRRFPPRLVHMKSVHSMRASIASGNAEFPDRFSSSCTTIVDKRQFNGKMRVENNVREEDEDPMVENDSGVGQVNAPPWGCKNEVNINEDALQTWEAHGFWRCSFCDGRIRGV